MMIWLGRFESLWVLTATHAWREGALDAGAGEVWDV